MAKEPYYLIKMNRKKEYYFVLRAPNGKTIAKSESYKTKQGCLKGVKSVLKNAARAVIRYD